jgi:predicted transcriptional regulator
LARCWLLPTDRPLIASGKAVARSALNQAMTEALGASSADGAWSQRDSFQMLEVATILRCEK